MEKPSIPKGTRDFGPAQMAKRQFILENIKKVFQKYGFQPLETPAMENLTTLTGKYGDEGDQLLFKILDSGDYPKGLKDYINFSLDDQKLAYNFFENLVLTIDKNYSNHENLEELILQITNHLSDSFNSVQINNDLRILLEDYLKHEISYISFTLNNWLFQHRKNSSLEQNHEIQKIINNIAKSYAFQEVNNLKSKELTPLISEKGLRYDLTVPFARYVVMNRGEISFPFKRYQIQPVWRADRPQKGRYREFYQCDADVVGTDSLVCEVEIILMIKEVFSRLGIKNYSIKINHRAILSHLAQTVGAKGNESQFFTAIDKRDKIGDEKVKEDLLTKGFFENDLEKLFDLLNYEGGSQRKMESLFPILSKSEKGKKGVDDINAVYSMLKECDNDEHVEFDIALARGLSYYTGCIFEVKINNVAIGSVSGGGRYDNLTGNFGMPDVSGVGISFGVDRLYDAMEELQLFPKEAQISSTVMIAHFDEETMRYGLKAAHELRQNGIATEIYPDQTKLKKQLDYANKKMIPFVIVIGSDELKDGLLTLKNMEKGEQEKLSLNEIVKKLTVGR